LEVTVVLPSQDTISFVGTHFDHLRDETDRISQAKQVNQSFKNNPFPTILAGDLNATPGSTPIDILEEEWTATYDKESPAPTFSSADPKIKIDYVMYAPSNHWRILDKKVIADSIASDHCAYLVTLELIK
jgi:endonuclease/exonuclease/phosphatase family metal-dependent hydrolase